MAVTDAYVMQIRGQDLANLNKVLGRAKFAASAGVLGPALVAGGLIVENEAKRLVRKKTGNLARSIHTSAPRVKPRSISVAVGTDVAYGPAIEYGSAPHVIRPKNARMLRFVIGGRIIYARAVNHPGGPPRPFLRPAASNKRANVYKEVIDAVSETIARAAA